MACVLPLALDSGCQRSQACGSHSCSRFQFSGKRSSLQSGAQPLGPWAWQSAFFLINGQPQNAHGGQGGPDCGTHPCGTISFQNSVDTAKPLLRKAIQISQQTPYWHCRLLFQLAVRPGGSSGHVERVGTWDPPSACQPSPASLSAQPCSQKCLAQG